MRFKHRQQGSDLPEVNLVPMMDVLMTVLTFFIIVSMTLRGQQLANVRLPETDGAGGVPAEETEATVTLVVGLNAENEILINNQPVTTTQLTQQIQQFLSENPQGMVLLKADRGLRFSQVSQVLKTMRDIGGSQVSLAFDRSEAN
ncbi:ExbD/TolR family protein [Thermocoleostomius sinensis]|jgi:biopolymer transport protein ExbD|uniref:Biopolymer transporter ExbD n=1 Tax=Thermocoleostomius sinensis A174 TaxID=2016057 RepID=A0A9E9C9J6_9CYAN|nr:biopolymer transporter ExbD [Thermocoleostomius sinensis]WAL61668.1 biopolymer transporter ExbD [Thermocoleostomius sinensis A174]